MPKLSVDKLPAYRRHKARGLAVVTLSGMDFYLGPYGTSASRSFEMICSIVRFLPFIPRTPLRGPTGVKS